MPLISGTSALAKDVNPFGNGKDGAFNETSGTTNLTQGTIYQYTTFNLGSSATISASSTSDKPIIIYVQGDATIDGTIDLKGKGCPDSFEGYVVLDWNNSVANEHFGIGTKGGFGNPGGSTSSSITVIEGIKGSKSWNFQQNQAGFIMNGTAGGSGDTVGNGGGGGASSSVNGSRGAQGTNSGSTQGSGGAGGCTLFMVVGGDLTFGASSSIDVSGNDGANGSRSGGGGGGSGDILIFYNGAITDNGVTKTLDGGAGGTDTTDGDGGGGAGAAGIEKIVAYDTILWHGGAYPTV